jgi:hypothetical protein
MMFDWYKIINKAAFDALNIPSKEYELILGELGLKTVLMGKGNYYSFLYEDVFLTHNLNDKNPFSFEGLAIYLDENNDFWLGIESE